MAQIKITWPDDLIAKLRQEARRQGLSLSVYTQIVLNKREDSGVIPKEILKKPPAKRPSNRYQPMTEEDLAEIRRLDAIEDDVEWGSTRNNQKTGEEEIFAYNTMVCAAHWVALDYYADNIVEYLISKPD